MAVGGAPAALLALDGITKRYGGVLANDDVSLAVAPGTVHALLGENGAGKSTLVKIVYGLVAPDAGRIAIDGRPVAIASPRAARRLGIGMVFQHFNLFEALNVAENVALGLEPAEARRLVPRIAETAERYGLAVDPTRPVHALSVGERQRVEILRCLLQDARLLMLDEPTSVLTPQESERLFAVVRRLADEGRSVLFISHKLDEIRAHCGIATVLRAGRVVASCDPRAETAGHLAELMVGRRLAAPHARPPRPSGPLGLVVADLTAAAATPFGIGLDGVSFAVAAGEILGIAGIAGNGQSELLGALTGERTVAAAMIRLGDGTEIGGLGVADRRALGLAAIPEERIDRGAVGAFALADNVVLGVDPAPFVQGGLIRRAAVARYADRVIAEFGVVASGRAAPARTLSGGNLQKFIVGRAMLQAPSVLVAAHPTWGVDVGAAAAIRAALVARAAAGAAVVVVSEDLDEMFAMCDRIAVLSRGRLSPPVPVGATSVEAVGLLMSGGAAPREAAAGR